VTVAAAAAAAAAGERTPLFVHAVLWDLDILPGHMPFPYITMWDISASRCRTAELQAYYELCTPVVSNFNKRWQ